MGALLVRSKVFDMLGKSASPFFRNNKFILFILHKFRSVSATLYDVDKVINKLSIDNRKAEFANNKNFELQKKKTGDLFSN